MNNADFPAMPQTHADNLCQQTGAAKPEHAGLTKREMFAMAAMQGLLANEHYTKASREHDFPVARMAVNMADSLLAELERKK